MEQGLHAIIQAVLAAAAWTIREKRILGDLASAMKCSQVPGTFGVVAPPDHKWPRSAILSCPCNGVKTEVGKEKYLANSASECHPTELF